MKKYFSSISFCIGFGMIALMSALLLVSLVHLPCEPNAMELTNKLSVPGSRALAWHGPVRA